MSVNVPPMSAASRMRASPFWGRAGLRCGAAGRRLDKIVRLEQQAAGLGGKRPVIDAGRTHAVGRALELLAALPLGVAAADQIAFNEENLLPVFMHERHGGEC